MFKIYTDGACKGNPGKGGWGVHIQSFHEYQYPDINSGVCEKIDDKTVELRGYCSYTTNNQMEMYAIIIALMMTPEESSIELYTDSQYVKNGILSWIHGWKKNGWKTRQGKPVKNKEHWMKIDELSSKRMVKYNWVKGHSGDPMNDRVDWLANQAIIEFKKGS